MKRVLVLGVGNQWRGDDGAGIAVAQRLSDLPADVRTHSGEPAGLLEAWRGRDSVVVVDAVRTGAPPGTVHRLDVSDGRALPVPWRRPSTHDHGVATAVELSRALRHLPRRFVIYGIEPDATSEGEGLSPPVRRAVEEVARRVAQEVTS